ncbi:hypothetical protein BDA99DRAFT_484527 [Phascolomyces articulosus]|uniref:NAD(P)-binding domain-containing protein n=1 Tax=Phascolomyces articulosus TaxID=60185 RepID=A0AAD5K5R5_9FUNG|nr:hypothetical protein BDA99DRAFT_484527 [Phascolomyces articulosus]
MVYDHKIYLIGATGNIGRPLVRKLLSNPKVSLTLFARSPAKVQEIYGNQPAGKLQIVQGDHENLKPFEDSIAGHTRLFLLIQANSFKNSERIVRSFAEKAYASGIQQVVLISGICTNMSWRSNVIAEAGYNWENAVNSIPNRRAFVTLRPAYFMSNQLGTDALSIKSSNKIIDTRGLESPKAWISPNDIGELAAIILQEPIEKHEDAVYDMVGDPKTPKEHAEILSRVLGREIVYEKVTDEQCYDMMTKQAGMPHALAYTMLYLSKELEYDHVSPGLSVLLGRQPETLEQWIEKNKNSFL